MPAYGKMAGRPWRETVITCTLAAVGDAGITLAINAVGALAAGSLRWGLERRWPVYATVALPKQGHFVWTPESGLTIFALGNMKNTTLSNRIDLMFRAFSDRTRLRILHLLQAGELCVGDIVDILGVPQPRVSRHLAYLRKAGLVLSRKAGLWSFYSLAPARTPFHQNLVNCLATCFRDVPEIKADHERAEKVRMSGGCCPQ